MRTTVTLDDDLAVRLDQRRAERGMTFRDALNDAVRRGLAAAEEQEQAGPMAVTTRPLALGRRLISDSDNVAEALAVAEGETFG
jgi:metal-responsive CopG/Arc/MetJ family transcriptional regulator